MNDCLSCSYYFSLLQCLYEDHVRSLKEKLSLFSTTQMRQAVGGKEVHVVPSTAPLSSGNAQLEKISRENQQLKEEVRMFFHPL